MSPAIGLLAQVAVAARFELANAGVKVPCLSTWLHHNIRQRLDSNQRAFRPFVFKTNGLNRSPTLARARLCFSFTCGRRKHTRDCPGSYSRLSPPRPFGLLVVDFGLEPKTFGISDRCATNCANLRCCRSVPGCQLVGICTLHEIRNAGHTVFHRPWILALSGLHLRLIGGGSYRRI